MASGLKAIPIQIPTLGLLKAMNREQVGPEGLTDSENWILRDRDFRVRPGLTPFGNSVLQRPNGIVHYDHGDGSLRTVMSTINQWRNFNYSTHLWTIIGATLTSTTEQQVFRVIAQSGATYLIGTNWKDPPKKWDGTAATYSDIGGSPPIARTMLILNSRVILANLRTGINPSPVSVDWGNFNNFDAGWNQQGTLLADTPGEIVIGEEMGNSAGALIKTDAAYRATAQTGTVPFRFDYVPVPQDGGAAASLGYCRPGGGNTIVYLALDGSLKAFDLNSVTDLGSEHARVHIQETMDFTTIGRSWMAYDPATSEIFVVYPGKGGSGEPDNGIVLKKGGAFYPIRWGGRKFTAGACIRMSNPLRLDELTVPLGTITKTLAELGLGNTVRDILGGESTGQAYSFIGDDDAGTPIAFQLETGLSPLGDGSTFKSVNSVEHRFGLTTTSQPVNVQIGSSKHGEDRTLSGPQTIDLAEPITKVTGHRVTSKYLSMRFTGSATKPVIWRGSYVSAAERGSWR